MELLDEALGRIKEMRETWVQVMEKVKSENVG